MKRFKPGTLLEFHPPDGGDDRYIDQIAIVVSDNYHKGFTVYFFFDQTIYGGQHYEHYRVLSE